MLHKGADHTTIAMHDQPARKPLSSSVNRVIIAQTSRANAPQDEQILTDIERRQLIAILETALNVLRSPLVERGLLKKARRVLVKGAESAAKKGVQEGLGVLMHSASARIAELIAMIFI
jgi:hypothetical protein